jgi:hypothetical protein
MVRQLLHDRRRVRHGQQDPGSPSYPLLGASIMHELLEVGCVVGGRSITCGGRLRIREA